MFNLQGSEIIFILLLALVVLGPEKLPSAIRRFTQTYAELRKMGTGFQTELRSALDEPMREMRETADLIKENADPSRVAAHAEDDDDARAESERDDPDRVDAELDDAEQAERDNERKERAQQAITKRREQRFSFDLPSGVNGATGPAVDGDTDGRADDQAGDDAASAEAAPGDDTDEVASTDGDRAGSDDRTDTTPVQEATAVIDSDVEADEWADPVDEERTA